MDPSPYDPEVVDSKAVRAGYAPPPFYFKQTAPSGAVRYVAWPGNATRAQAVFGALLRAMPDELEVLLKIDKLDTADGPTFLRYHGPVSRDKLLDVIEQTRDLIYRDGYTQLCVRQDDGEYIVLDEYGLIWVYSDGELVTPLAEHLIMQPTELISDGGQFRRRIKDAEEVEKRFVTLLDLEQVE